MEAKVEVLKAAALDTLATLTHMTSAEYATGADRPCRERLTAALQALGVDTERQASEERYHEVAGDARLEEETYEVTLGRLARTIRPR